MHARTHAYTNTCTHTIGARTQAPVQYGKGGAVWRHGEGHAHSIEPVGVFESEADGASQRFEATADVMLTETRDRLRG